jgi:hypothetical protein
MKVSAQSLRQASAAIQEIAHTIHDTAKVPYLGGSRGVDAMPGSAISQAMTHADDASTQAKKVIHERYQYMADLLSRSADEYVGTDAEIADGLKAMGDVNLGKA